MDDELAEDVRWLASHPDILELARKQTEACGQMGKRGIALRRQKAARISTQEVALCTYSAPANGSTLFLTIGAIVDVNQQLHAAWRATILQYQASWLELREYQCGGGYSFQWNIRSDGYLATRHLFRIMEMVWSIMKIPPEGLMPVKKSDVHLVQQALIECGFPSEPASHFVAGRLFEDKFAYAIETGNRARPIAIEQSILENDDTPPQGTPLP